MMNKTVWIALWAATILAAFAIGASIHTLKKSEIQPAQQAAKTNAKKPPSDHVPVLLAVADNLRNDHANKEQKILDVDAELAEVRAKLPPPLTPEEEQERRRRERQETCKEKSQELQEKILQRQDSALRAQALSELTALLQSQDVEELLVALHTVCAIQYINCDREAFKPYILASLSHQDPEVRKSAIWPAYAVCSREEQLEILLSMVKDPSADVRRVIANREGWLIKDNEKEKVFSAFRVLLQDEEWEIKKRAMDTLGRWPEHFNEMEALAIELSNDERHTDEMMRWLALRPTISAEVAGHLVDMMQQGQGNYPAYYQLDELRDRSASDERKSVLSRHCLETLRDSLDHEARTLALLVLRRLGNIWVLPELEKISHGPHAEGIEGTLGDTIERLRKKASEQR